MTATMRLLCRVVLGSKFTVTGIENLPGAGPLIVCSNHVSVLDTALIPAILRRKAWSMAKAEAFRGPVGPVIRQYGAFPVNRHRPDRRALAQATKVLAGGEILVLYPEGHRSPDASLQRAERGVGYLIRRAGVAVLPIALQGTQNCLPVGSRLPRRAPVRVVVGRPFQIEIGGRDPSPGEYLDIADLVMFSIAELLPEHLRGVYASVPPVDLMRRRRVA